MTRSVGLDKLAGILVGAACGDALGAGYEFRPPLPADSPVRVRGQGAFGSGEWTDDTAQLLAIALAAADGNELDKPSGEDAVAAYFQAWYLSPARLKDIGIHSSAVFGAVSALPADGLAERFRIEAADKEHRHPGTSGGNGALMRTASVALALHHDPERMVATAMRLASMTHADDRSTQSCAVWCLAIRRALMTSTPWDAAQFRQRVEEVERLWPPGAQPTYVLSSHDAPRHRTRFDDPAHGDARARVAALMLLTLRGTPFLYYGEELGLRDGEIPPDRIRDPVGQRFPALGRDPERTPMPWDASANAGFSPADPWLPLGAEWPTVNVAAQRDDPASMLSFYRRVIWWRKSAPALLEGSLRVLDGPEGTFVYAREHAGQRLIVALNFTAAPATVSLPAPGRVVLSTAGRAEQVGATLVLRPVEGVIVECGDLQER